MVDRAKKFFRKLDDKQYGRIYRITENIKANKLAGLDIKPMKAHKGWYRCRVGKIRIIFIKTSSGPNIIETIDFRGEVYTGRFLGRNTGARARKLAYLDSGIVIV